MELDAHTIAQRIASNPELIDRRDNDGRTMLHWACSSGNLETVKFLLESGADPEKVDESEWTALHIGASSGHEAVVRVLLATDRLDVFTVNETGQNPLHYASSRNRLACAKELLAAAGTRAPQLVNTRDNFGYTSFHRATARGYTAVMELLLQHGADAVAADMDGNTPLHLAVIELSVGVASVLVEAMTEEQQACKNAHGKSAYDLARDKTQILYGHGEDYAIAKQLAHLLGGEKEPCA